VVDEYVGHRPGLRILDLGCGPGDLVRYLPEGIEYTGTDLSEAYIESAKHRFGSRGRFFAGRIDELDVDELGEFDVVLAKSVLHHIDEEEALHLFKVAAGVLARDGRLVTVDAAFTPDMSRAARFVVSRDRGQSILTPEGYRELAQRAFDSVDVAVHHGLLRIPYTHVFMACSRPKAAAGPSGST
jgi:SAM-dependent methyltransferase